MVWAGGAFQAKLDVVWSPPFPTKPLLIHQETFPRKGVAAARRAVQPVCSMCDVSVSSPLRSPEQQQPQMEYACDAQSAFQVDNACPSSKAFRWCESQSRRDEKTATTMGERHGGIEEVDPRDVEGHQPKEQEQQTDKSLLEEQHEQEMGVPVSDDAQAEESVAAQHGFAYSVEQLVNLSSNANLDDLQRMGGVTGLSAGLAVDLEMGINGDDAEDLRRRVEAYGANTYPKKPLPPFLWFVWQATQDPILIILMVCAALSLFFGMIAEGAHEGWHEGVAICIAVLIVVTVTAVTDYRQALQFQGLDAEKEDIQLKVIRGGRSQAASIFDLVVGDIVPLAIGDQVPGDGVFISGHSLTIDESYMTGESDPMHKDAYRPFLMSGCKVVDGYGTMLVTAVGTNTEWGRIMATVNKDDESVTPLQARLSSLAKAIGKVGVTVAICVLIFLVVRYFTDYYSGQGFVDVIKELVDEIAIAVSIVVVAIPEGLPLAVTLTLAYSMRQMMNDKALVRNMAACETMGSATAICSDKTGTLTLNQMTVVREWQGGELHKPDSINNFDPSSPLLQVILEGVAQNSTGTVFIPENGGEAEVSASPTETAIIQWALALGMDYNRLRHSSDIISVEAFNSTKKRAGVAVKRAGGDVVVHWKGAAEMVLANCTHWMDAQGNAVVFTHDKLEAVQASIAAMAASSLRCIALASAPIPSASVPDDTESWQFPDTSLSLLAIVGIKDPCRPGVPEAVARCQKAGVKVRMVTGDNVLTAQAIARECGILTPDGIVIEGKDFRVLPLDRMMEIIPTIDVMARSSPTDKHLLVSLLQRMGEVVAVTGDGTNDAPALYEADIGLSMGLSGTEVAKESSDIVILDDNFASIVRVVRWGRSVFASIQKYIQFQLTVNICALTLNFITALTDGSVPLTTVQLLWVNLIMNTLGALALATEPPTSDLLEQPPVGRTAPLITNIMWRNIFTQAAFQLTVLLVFNYGGISLLGIGGVSNPKQLNNTIIFNTFVFCQLFNEINARRPNKFNVFERLHRSPIFIAVLCFSVTFQALVIEVFQSFAGTTSLSWNQWLLCIGIGAISLPLAFVAKFIPVSEVPLFDCFKRLRTKRRKSSRYLITIQELQASAISGAAAATGTRAAASSTPAAAEEKDGRNAETVSAGETDVAAPVDKAVSAPSVASAAAAAGDGTGGASVPPTVSS
ncbi:unnamed protein product [Closterium sp. NIES-65]|nr:unnamed protein product [Closterium sp. NIES-65]